MMKRSVLRALLVLIVCTLMGAGVALSNGTPPAKAKSPPSVFQGTSDKGDFEDALKAALDSAMASRRHIADAMVEWKIKEISGAQGGIAGVNRLTVTIEVKPQ